MRRISLFNVMSAILITINVAGMILATAAQFFSSINSTLTPTTNVLLLTFCFLATGIALQEANRYPLLTKRIYICIGTAFIFFALILNPLLFQRISTPLYLEKLYSVTGHISNLTALEFILAGLAFILLPLTNKNRVALLAQACAFFIFLIAILVLIGNFFNIHFNGDFTGARTVSIYLGINFVLLSSTWWALWHNSDEYYAYYKNNDDWKILLVSSAILFSVASITTLIGILILIHPNITSFYQLLLTQLKIIIPALFCTTFIGSLLLHWEVSPLVRRMLRLKKKALTSKIRLRAIMDHVVEGIVTIDEYGIIKTYNPKTGEMFGCTTNEMLGKKLKTFIPSLMEIQTKPGSQLSSINILHYMKNHSIEATGKRLDGSTFPIELAISDIYIKSKHLYACILRDISQRKEADAKLQESEALFKAAFNAAPIGMALINLDGKVTQINASLCEILGHSESELKQIGLSTLTYPEDMKLDQEKQNEIVSGAIQTIQFIKRFYHKNGHIIWTLLNASLMRDSNGHPLQFIAQIQDITKQREEEERLNYKAHYDALTGLVNRSYLELNLNHAIASAQRNAKKFVLFFLDLDNFKSINDTLGHDAGDTLLKIVAERLTQSTRKSDIVARLGGDEFILVLTELQDFQIAANFADRIIGTLLKAITIKSHELFVTTSIGISFYPADGTDAATLIQNADHALYKAKEKGRNNYQFCANEVSTKIVEKMEFETKLKQAIDNDELKIFYLPVVNPNLSSVSSVEALLRWQSDKYGLVNPQQIIPIAEENGFIIPLSEWIITTACRQVQLFQKDISSSLRLSINISARQFMHSQLIESVLNGLQTTQFNPKLFTLEINENLIMQDPKLTIDTLQILEKNNIQIVIDNFGSGYSSLTYLQDFKVSAVKIDRTLVQMIGINSRRNALVAAIIELARSLGIEIIAEGVETQEQYEFLLNHGCYEMQGYYICKPMLAKQIIPFLESYATSSTVHS